MVACSRAFNGGFDLAAQWMGWDNVFHCEWDKKCQELLKRRFPTSIGYGDIKETDFTQYANTIDIISGGFPCQPFSTAGKRKGTEDDRYLWPQMLRAIREISPRWIVGENVRGLTNWNGGLVFEQVCSDLENEGYKVIPVILPACSVNAPHRRERIWFIAYSNNSGTESRCGANGDPTEKIWRQNKSNVSTSLSSIGATTNTSGIGQSGSGRPEGQMRAEANGDWKASWSYTDGRWPTQSPVCNGNDGLPADLDLSGISKKDFYIESLKAAGNAIVPQVVFEIFKAIAAYNKQ